MVTHDRNNLMIAQGLHHLLGLWTITDIVAKGKNPVRAQQGNIGQHRL